jgi:hypothetical protein
MALWVYWQDGLSTLPKLQEVFRALGIWAVPIVLGISLLATWASVGLSASLVLAGRSSLLSWVLFVGLGTFLAWVITVNYFIARELQPQAMALSAGVFGFVCLGGTAWAFSRAVRQRLVRRQTAILCGLGWLLLCAILFIVWRDASPHAWLASPFFPGLLALPLAPLATAPLALAWNRHR